MSVAVGRCCCAINHGCNAEAEMNARTSGAISSHGVSDCAVSGDVMDDDTESARVELEVAWG